jgi:hypothetical protein
MGIFTKQENQEGSCLVELLLVLVIIGILLSIGIPVYSVIIWRTEELVCSTNSSHLSTITNMDPQVSAEDALNGYLEESGGQHFCPSGGTYIYYRSRVGCSVHDEIEDHAVCAYNRLVLKRDYHRYLKFIPEHYSIMTWNEFFGDNRDVCPSSGVIDYNSGAVVCSLHHGGHDDGDDGSVPFL